MSQKSSTFAVAKVLNDNKQLKYYQFYLNIMRKIFFLCALCATMTAFATDGALSGKFSIDWNGHQIVFSQGNLQFQASTGTWRFAENQLDIIGSANTNISDTYSGWIDLFGFSTSGYNEHYPWLKTTSNAAYDPGDTVPDLNGTEFDWGYHNPIANGGNTKGLWRTPSQSDMMYILRSRDNADNLFFQVTINGQEGALLLPDDWTPIAGITLHPLTDYGSWNGGRFTPTSSSPDLDLFTYNALTIAQWQQLEAKGAVFFPSGGIRLTSDNTWQSLCKYWLSGRFSKYMGNNIHFHPTNTCLSCSYANEEGLPVRLIQDVKSGGTTALDNSAADAKAAKRLVNGQLLIERDGRIYNAQGVEVK